MSSIYLNRCDPYAELKHNQFHYSVRSTYETGVIYIRTGRMDSDPLTCSGMRLVSKLRT